MNPNDKPTDTQPNDHLTKDTAIAPPDKFESPREESIVTTDPHANLDEGVFNESERLSDMDLARTHDPLLDRLEAAAHSAARHGAGGFPWKIIGGSMLLALWGGLYLGTYSGGFQGDVFNEQASYKAVASGPVDPAVAKRELGKKLFTVNCVQCHQYDGKGVAGQYPPLVGSEWVIGDAPKRLEQILLHGIIGTIHVKGETYNNNMPNWNVALKDKEIAAVLTYIRSEWGNSAPPIMEEDLAAARKETADRTEYWSEAELLKIPAGPLGGGPGAAAPAPAGGAAGPAAGGAANPASAQSAPKPALSGPGEGPATSAPSPKP